MGVWKTLPHYPTQEDVIYEISIFLLKEGKSNGDFSQQNLNSIFGTRWEDTKHGELIKNMIENGIIEETKKSNPSKKWYKLNLKD
jgi:hypothetical protein